MVEPISRLALMLKASSQALQRIDGLRRDSLAMPRGAVLPALVAAVAIAVLALSSLSGSTPPEVFMRRHQRNHPRGACCSSATATPMSTTCRRCCAGWRRRAGSRSTSGWRRRGWKLSDHWTQVDSAARRLLRDRKWDVVVLQEQSTLGSTAVIDGVARVGPDDQFQRYAKLWQEEIHRAGMTPAFYLTWARKGRSAGSGHARSRVRHRGASRRRDRRPRRPRLEGRA